jgi:hypothetical protein
MKKLTKVLAALMLVGFGFSFNAHANGSCGFDGNNPGGLSFSECVRQEFIYQGNKLTEEYGLYKFYAKHGKEKGNIKLDEYFDLHKTGYIAGLDEKDLKVLERNIFSVKIFIQTLSIGEIRKRADESKNIFAIAELDLELARNQ